MIIQMDYQEITEGNIKKILKYYLIKEMVEKKFIYGVLVEKINSNNIVEDFEEALGVTDNLELIKNLFLKIKKFSVTPITLLSVIDNFISEANS